MTNLINGCSYSDVWVSPSDWSKTTSQKTLKKEWYVQCIYHDPLFKDKYPNGFPFRKKLNRIKGLDARKEAVKLMLREIPLLFENAHFNPITKRFMVKEAGISDKVLTPTLPATEAIEIAWNHIITDAVNHLKQKSTYNEKKKPFNDVRIAKDRFIKGFNELRFNDISIKGITLAHIKENITYLKITDGYHKKFLSYMSKIWTELIEYGCVDSNPFKLLKKRKPQKKIREVIDKVDFVDIMDYLHENCYEFYRYAWIFHMSGARTTELFSLQKKHVNLEKQEYKVWILKGDRYVEEIKVIMLDALPYWKELLSESDNNEDYLFSKDLCPGTESISPRQISRRWNRHVKTNYSAIKGKLITADFYTLKHLFLDFLDEMQHNARMSQVIDLNRNIPENIAQIHASHRSPNITNAVYLKFKQRRDREVLKHIILKRAI